MLARGLAKLRLGGVTLGAALRPWSPFTAVFEVYPEIKLGDVTGREVERATLSVADADIDKMVKDAELHAAEDKKRHELVDAKNQGESMIHTAEKSLTEHGDKVSAADKSTIEAAVTALKSALEGEDVEAIKAKTNDLVQASMKLGEAMYRNLKVYAGPDHPHAAQKPTKLEVA